VSASFNIGALFQPWGGTRFGLHYVHEMSHELDSQVRYLGLNAAGATTLASLQSIGGFIDQDATAPFDLPLILTFSAYHELTPTLALLADLAWADWSVFDDLQVNFSRVDTILGTSSVTPEDWDDTIRIALGVLYRHDERWTFRGGIAYDETPVPDATRTPRIPDESRYWIAAGIGYRWKALEINFSYAHSFVEDATVNDTTRLRNNLVGTFDNSTDIFSIGGTLRF
jgi:long-chain fatty acid transport protein